MDYSFCLQDLNQVIKIFSYAIQQRIDELGSLEIKPKPHPKSEDELNLLSKYQHCKIKDEKNIQCVNKFCQRIMQVFSYFKSRSNHKNLLNLLEEKLVTNIDNIVTKVPIVLGSLLKLILVFVKTPFQVQQGKRNPVELSMSSFKLKINTFQRSKRITSPSNPFNQVSSSIETRCFTSSAQPTKIVDVQKPESKQLKTSTSGIHIRRHISQNNRPSTKKQKFLEQDLKCYSQLDLDKKYIIYMNQTINSSLKEVQQKISKEFLKRNESIKLNIDSYSKCFEERTSSVEAPKILTEVTNRKTNVVDNKKCKNGPYRNIKGQTISQSKKDISRKNRAHTSLREEVDQEVLASNLFRQRRLRRLFQENGYMRSSIANVSMAVKNHSHVNVVKIM